MDIGHEIDIIWMMTTIINGHEMSELFEPMNLQTDRRTNERRTDGRHLWRNLKENEQKDINVYVFDFVNIFVFVLFSGHKYSPKQPGQYNIKIEKYFSRLVGVVEILLFVRFS